MVLSRSVVHLLFTVCCVAALDAGARQQAPPPPPPPPPPGVVQDVRIMGGGAGGVMTVNTIAGGGAFVPMSPVEPTGTGLIVGKVVDVGSGQGVPGAVVAIGGAAPSGPSAAGPARVATVVSPGVGTQTFQTSPGSPNQIPRVMTDAQGRFAFRSVPQGSFNLTAAKPGYVDGAYGRHRPNGPSQPLDLKENERIGDVVIKVFRLAAISGVVSDESGEPVVQAQVVAYRRNFVAGRRVLTPAGRSGTTDDRGVYRLFNLIPGDYVVGVPTAPSTIPSDFQMQGQMPPDLLATIMTPGSQGYSISTGGAQVTRDSRFLLQNSPRGGLTTVPDPQGRLLAYPTTYYPSAPVVSQAQTVTIGSGEERSGVDIAAKLVPTVNISGRLVGPDGGVSNYALHLVPAETGEMSADPDVAAAITSGDGSFLFVGVPAGQYVIQTIRVPRPSAPSGASMVVTTGPGGTGMAMTETFVAGGRGGAPPALPTEPTLWAALPMAVGVEDILDVTVTLSPGARLSGRIEFEGASERPTTPQRLGGITANLESADGKPRASTMPGRVDANGQFTTQGVPPGKYLLRVGGAPAGWTLKSATVDGVDISETPLDLEGRDVSGVVITFTDRISTLSGNVKSSKSTPDNAAAVLLFPADSRQWMNHGFNPRRMRMVRTSSTGAYSFGTIPPGDYFVVAISEEFAGEWQDPRFLEALSGAAARLTVIEGDKRTHDLPRQDVRPPGVEEVLLFSLLGSGFSRTLPGPAEAGLYSKHDTQQVRDARAEPAEGTATISGTVILDQTGQPIRRARVSMRFSDGRTERIAATDDQGRFTIAGLAAGNYSLSATKPAYLTAYYGSRRPGRAPGSPLTLAAGQQLAGITLSMSRGAVISGAVTDQYGMPVPGAMVRLLQDRYVGSERQLTSTSMQGLTTTDDRGMFRAFGLMPGSYVVGIMPPVSFNDVRQLSAADVESAYADLRLAPSLTTSGGIVPTAPGTTVPSTPAPPPGRSVGYAPVYYPGALSVAEASQVTVAAGQELTGIDVPFRLVPTARIEGSVVGPDGRPMTAANVVLFGNDMAMMTPGLAIARTTPAGTFVTGNVAPGRYTLHARAHDSGADVPPFRMNLFAQTDIDVSGLDLTGVVLTLQPGATISGRIVFDSKTGLKPPDAKTLRVMLTAAGPIRPTMGVPAGQVDESGTFKFEGVPPGTYGLMSVVPGAGNMPAGSWLLKSAVVDGRDTRDTPLDIRPGQNVQNALLTFTDHVAELSGTLTDGAGKPASDFSILVFTTDRSLWAGGNRRIVPPVQSGVDGKFRVRGMPPGEYYVGALLDLEPGSWTDPSFLEQLATVAIKVTIAEGEKKVQDIRIAGGS